MPGTRGGVPAAGSDSTPDAFAMMMRSSQKKDSLEGRAKRTRDGCKVQKQNDSKRLKLNNVEDARREMMSMGFEAAAIDRALKLHAHGTLVDLAVAVAACISSASDGTCSQKSASFRRLASFT
jgi:hypothetical protein